MCPSLGKWMRKICWVLTMEYCAQVEALLHTTEHTLLLSGGEEKNQTESYSMN